ncbi:DUF4303 domain-containing protein [Microbulbifer sp. SSSA002]|uniref:DUF4303 domain-containing protein n=1 Tax=Microbulbifer sp. SSSA002 TaxID=3243376 RepID=UPI004039D027
MPEAKDQETIENYDWALAELNETVQEELSTNLKLLQKKYRDEDLYGVVLDDSLGCLKLRFQTRSGLSEAALKRAQTCEASQIQLENLLRWSIEEFQHDEQLNLKKSSSIAQKISSRIWSTARDKRNRKKTRELYRLQKEVSHKIKQIYINNLFEQYHSLFTDSNDTPAWPIGISYCNVNKDRIKNFEYMSRISGEAVSQWYYQLGDGSIFSSLDTKTQTTLSTLLEELAKIAKKETGDAFKRFIADYAEHNIYSLYLYHNGDCTSYLFPSLTSEKGLDYVAQAYYKHSQLSLEDNRTQLRWSPCDSPYHTESETALKQTETLLQKLSNTIDRAGEHAAKYLNIDPCSDKFYDLHREVSEKIHQALIQQLKEIALLPEISEYIKRTGCVIWITAGDTSHDPIEDIAKIHNRSVADKIQQEMEEGYRLSSIDHELQTQHAEQEKESPTPPSFCLSDFDALLEKFNPSFFDEDGGIYLKQHTEQDFFRNGSSESEAAQNRLNLMSLLKESPFYEEIDKLYGHFIGAEFKKDDFLPSIGRRFALKLGDILQQEFPQKSFIIHMEVSRNSLSRIEFFQNRHDGFMPGFKSAQTKEGVKEVWLIGSKPASVKFPVGVFASEGKAYAQVFGIVSNKLLTNKSLSEHNVICEGSDYDQAYHHAKEALLEHLNESYNKAHLDFDCVHYPEAAKVSPSQGLTTYDMHKYHEHVQYWRMLEVTPDYLIKNLVS